MKPHRLETAGPIVFGHRGCSALAPENTLAAFALIAEQKIPGVELDVHQCLTGEIVVSHDDTLQRTAGVPVSIHQTACSDIREHDVGAWFAPEFAGQQLPLLEEVFELLGETVCYDIEIKHEPKAVRRGWAESTEAKVARLIIDYGLAHTCMVSSFDPFVLRRMARIAGEIPRAIIYGPEPELPAILRAGHGAWIGRATVLKPRSDATASALRRAGDRPVIPWTVDDPARARELVEIGVRGIISNRPAEVLAELAAPGGAGDDERPNRDAR